MGVIKTPFGIFATTAPDSNFSLVLRTASNSKTPLVATFGEAEEGVPTCCDWVTGEAGHLVISFSTAACIIYDAETAAVVMRLDTGQDPVSGQPVGPINAVLAP